MSNERDKFRTSVQSFIRTNQYPKALEALLKWSQKDTSDPWIFSKIGHLYAKMGQRSEACSYYQTSAQMYEKAGFKTKAVAVYKQILFICPTSVDAKTRLAYLYRDLDMLDEAKALLKEASVNDAEASTVFQDVFSHQHRSLIKPAEKAVAMLYKEAQAYFKLGLRNKAALILCDIFTMEKDHQGAVLLWNQLTSTEQNQAKAVFNPDFDVDEEF